MGRETITALLEVFEEVADKVADCRQKSNARKYEIADVLKSAFAVFYFLHESLLEFEHAMQKKHKKNNLQTLFGVRDIPSITQIKNVVDLIEPQSMTEVFDKSLSYAKERGVLDHYRILDDNLAIALDGVCYHSSQKVSCPHCLKKEKDGITTYYHSALGIAIVHPESHTVLPLESEFIRNEDGEEKQDCERNAAKRYLERNKEKLKQLKPIFLGDDLYACHSICSRITEERMDYLFTCKPKSHPWIAEQVKYAQADSLQKTEWSRKNHLEYRYRWVNGIENRIDGEKLLVNYLYFEVCNIDKKKSTYTNSWITSKTINEENVAEIAKCGRTRWKIENEFNNVLKNHGYNLKHNFGHGKNHASEVFFLLIIASFLFHSIQEVADEDFKRAKAAFNKRENFFFALRYEMCRYLHESWTALLTFLSDDVPDS